MYQWTVLKYRDFMKMICFCFVFFSGSTLLIERLSTKNIWSPNDPEILLIMDYRLVIKRVRNNVLKSGT